MERNRSRGTMKKVQRERIWEASVKWRGCSESGGRGKGDDVIGPLKATMMRPDAD